MTRSGAEDFYNQGIALKDVRQVQPGEAVDLIAHLIDVATDFRRTEGIEHALKLIRQLLEPELALSSQHRSRLDYFTANAWAAVRLINGTSTSWNWDQPEVAQELLYLRKACINPGFQLLLNPMQSQALTNLGNVLSNLGRFVEAPLRWEQAVNKTPGFGMGVANRGWGLFHYARALYDPGHSPIFLLAALQDLEIGLSCREYPVARHARPAFKEKRDLLAEWKLRHPQ